MHITSLEMSKDLSDAFFSPRASSLFREPGGLGEGSKSPVADIPL
jgi:hypothetical protein